MGVAGAGAESRLLLAGSHLVSQGRSRCPCPGGLEEQLRPQGWRRPWAAACVTRA